MLEPKLAANTHFLTVLLTSTVTDNVGSGLSASISLLDMYSGVLGDG